MTPGDDDRVVGKNPLYLLLAIVVTVVVAIYAYDTGKHKINDTSDIILVGLLFGGAAGQVASAAWTSITVTPAGLDIVNFYRVFKVPRDCIKFVDLRSGLQIVLVSGRKISVSAFPGSLAIMMRGNPRAKAFMSSLTTTLALQEKNESATLPQASTGSIRVRMRRATLLLILLGAAIALSLGCLARWG